MGHLHATNPKYQRSEWSVSQDLKDCIQKDFQEWNTDGAGGESDSSIGRAILQQQTTGSAANRCRLLLRRSTHSFQFSVWRELDADAVSV